MPNKTLLLHRQQDGFAASLRRCFWSRAFVIAALFPGLAFWTIPASANPSGGVVVSGDVSIGLNAGGELGITQSSHRAIIEWDSFSINQEETTRFFQPNSSSVALNRVMGGDPSSIFGSLKANGNVFVINPNGILVGPNGSIDVNGLVLSTLDVKNGEFLRGRDLEFAGTSGKGIVNQGRIRGIGGDVFMIGRTVTNSGSIRAGGTAGLAAGEEVLLKQDDGKRGERLFVRATGSGVSGTGILNDGSIEGAAVELKAHGNLYALAINNKGTIRATGAETIGGRVFLRGVGGGVRNSGSIRATSPSPGNSASVLIASAYARVDGAIKAENIQIAVSQKADIGGQLDASHATGRGGAITVEAPEINFGSAAQVSADGAEGGGDVRIGGGFQGRDESIINSRSVIVQEGARISADALSIGNAGRVVLWADEAMEFHGTISAAALGSHGDGGLVEVSGKETLLFDGIVSTLSRNGGSGSLLLDPNDLTISGSLNSANNINDGTLENLVEANNVIVSTKSVELDDGNITVTGNVVYDSANSLTFLAQGDAVFRASVQNEGSGDVNVVAGWDGSTGFSAGPAGGAETGVVAMEDFFSSTASYGNAKASGGFGSVILNNASSRVVVGSRHGATQVAGYGLDLFLGANAGGRDLFVGFRDVNSDLGDLAATGDIRVEVRDAITLQNSGIGRTDGAKLGIGHGGSGGDTNPGPGDLSGDIVIKAGVGGLGTGNIILVNEGVSAGAGSERERVVIQIGHGGRRVHGVHSGAITIDTTEGTTGLLSLKSGDGGNNGAIIGHGGMENGVNANGLRRTPLSLSGDIDIRTKGDISLEAGSSRGADPSASWRQTTDAFVQIGHGGRNSDGDHSGTIVIRAGGNLVARSGDQVRNYAMIGHGGHSSDGTHSSLIDISSGGNLIFDARGLGGEPVTNTRNETFVQLGHGGYASRGDHHGEIVVNSGGNIEFYGGDVSPGGVTAYRAYAQLGHGGLDSDTPNNNVTSPGFSGRIQIDAVGDLIFQAGNGDEAFAQLGHGGTYSKGVHGGDIGVDVGGEIAFTAGRRLGYVQLGHGGYDADGVKTGNFDIRAGGDITFLAGVGTQAREFRANAQLGHGGYSTDGAHQGDILVASGGAIDFRAGNLSDNFAQIGHGGRSRSASTTEGFSGDISVTAANGISFTAGTMLARTGANGFRDRAPFTTLPDDANVTNGDDGIFADGRLFAQLGHGGYDADASNNNTYYDGVGHSGDILVATSGGDITFQGGSVLAGSEGNNEGRFHYAMLGHGGLAVQGDHRGAIKVDATEDSIHFLGGAQTLDFSVSNTTGVVSESTDVYNYAGLGHGGSNGSWGNDRFTGDNVSGRLSARSVNSTLSLDDGIQVTAKDSVSFEAGAGRRSYAQLGLGGYFFRGVEDGEIDHQGDIVVEAQTGEVALVGGSGTDTAAREAYAMIGHGGFESDGTHAGNITVIAGAGGVGLQAGTGTDDFAKIGHGGSGSSGSLTGRIEIVSEGSLTARGGLGESAAWGGINTAHQSYAQIGHGGREVDGANSLLSGDIVVRVAQQVEVIGAANAYRGYAQIGHGGGRSNSAQLGNISVLAGEGNSVVKSGQGEFGFESYAQIGHGGFAASGGDKTGNVEVVIRNGGNLDLFSSDNANSNSYVQIGNGGSSLAATDVSSGNTTVIVEGEISLQRGARSEIRVGNRGATVGFGDLTFIGGSIDHTVSFSEKLLVINDSVENSQIRNVWINPILTGNLGDVTIGTSGDGNVLWNRDYEYTSSSSLNLVSGRNINFVRVLENRLAGSSGAIRVVAGWDGVTGRPVFDWSADEIVAGSFDTLPLLADGAAHGELATSYGRNSGSVTLGRDLAGNLQANRTNVGSAEGDTVVLGQDVLLATGAEDASADWRGASQIGVRDGNAFDITGDIKVYATRDVTLTGAILNVGPNNTGGRGGMAMIGHGGFDNEGRIHEKLTGNIIVDAGRNVIATAGDNRDNWVQIGHGGRVGYSVGVPAGEIGGDITVRARTGDVEFTAGTGIFDFAHVGHGGRDADPEALDAITGVSSDITVEAGGDIVFRAGVEGLNGGYESWAQIGNGGYASDARGDGRGWYGDLILTAGGLIEFYGGDLHDNYAQIGNGGRSAHGVHSGDIVVTAGTGINFIAGTVGLNEGSGEDGRNYVQLGHGGYDADAADASVNSNLLTPGRGHRGDIQVTTATGDIRFYGGDTALGSSGNNTGRVQYAQLGHGGFSTGGDHRGAIKVTATTGSIDFRAGAADDNSTDTYNYAQLGHGGDSTSGNLSGANANLTGTVGLGLAIPEGITVTAGDGINFAASIKRRAQAQLGLGGWTFRGTHTSPVTVIAGSGGISFSAGPGSNTGSEGLESYAMLGNGGYDTDEPNNAGAGSPGSGGDIYVESAGGVRLTGGSANDTFAMIGNGGRSDRVDHSGAITVVTTFGDIVLTGGSQTRSGVQIGHGGPDSLGNYAGSIAVDAAGDIHLLGGNNVNAGALVGHGVSEANLGGSRSGGLHVRSAGRITMTDGVGAALIGHQSSDGVGAIDYAGAGFSAAGDQGYSLVGLNGLTFSETQRNGQGNRLSMAQQIALGLESGDVLIAAGGVESDLLIGGGAGNLNYESDFSVTFAAGRDLTVASGFQNSGGGAIQLIGGWANSGDSAVDATVRSGTLADIPALGTVRLPDFASVVLPTAPEIASFGINGGMVFLGGGQQVGEVAVGSRSGRSIALGYGVEVSGSDSTTGAGALLGYRNFGAVNVTGQIEILAHGGGFALHGGSAANGFAQVGHGGANSSGGSISAPISVQFTEIADLILEGGEGDLSYAQVGHGGIDSSGDISGALTFLGDLRNVRVLGGDGENAYAQIGFGGVRHRGTKSGTLRVLGEVIEVSGGEGNLSSAAIGHGGAIGSGEITGALEVVSESGAISMRGNTGIFSSAQIGHGGFYYTGDVIDQLITVGAATSIDLVAGDGPRASVRIGHGGDRAKSDLLSGRIDVWAGTGVTIHASDSIGSAAQIGHGGGSAEGTQSGDIVVIADSSILLHGGDRNVGAYAKIGHGDDFGDDNASAGGTGDRSGNILIQSGADLAVTDGMIGHVNHLSTALASDVDISIAVSTVDPDGLISLSGASEIAAVDELRVYLPERASNQIETGVLLNGESWVGTPSDPSREQRIDEYTIERIEPLGSTFPNEHDGTVGSGLAPATAAGFAFYYQRISIDPTIMAVVVEGPADDSGDPAAPDEPAFNNELNNPDIYLPEETASAEQLADGGGSPPFFDPFGFSYEGFSQYGPNGEVSVFITMDDLTGASGSTGLGSVEIFPPALSPGSGIVEPFGWDAGDDTVDPEDAPESQSQRLEDDLEEEESQVEEEDAVPPVVPVVASATE